MHVILGATGHVGGRVAERLLERGERIGVVGRRPDRLAPLVQRGAVPYIGNLEDAEFVLRAFSGARAVFSLIPPNPYARDLRSFQTRVGAAIATAVAGAGVTHVVNLSSLGAHLPAGTGPIVGLHEHENRLNALPGLQVLHLRPGFFMENLLANIDLIKANGINGSPFRGDLRLPVISARDVGDAAADRLLALDFRGIGVLELPGRDLSMNEMTRMLGQALGMPSLKYVQFSCEEAARAMVNQGVSPDVARLTMEMVRAFNEGRLGRGEGGPRPAGGTPFERFAGEFAAAYRRGLPEVDSVESGAALKR